MISHGLPSVLVLLCLVLALLMVVTCVEGEDDLYHTLGVSHSASSREIRSAYKRLAKKWHPDKNNLPEAKEKFIEINRAYEVLSDEDKRHTYDVTGEVGDSPKPADHHPHGNSFTVFTTGNGFQFRFFTGGGGSAHRGDSISTDAFFNNVLPNSHHKPYLINFYTNFCMQCGSVEQLWNNMRKEMTALGVGLGSVHANHHPRVTTHCGVNQVPTVVGVVSGRVIHFHGNLRGVDTMQDFLNNILPQNVVPSMSDVDAAESFLSQVISRNRPRVILLSPHRYPSLRYRLAAFAHQKTADCAFISTHQSWLNGQLLFRFKVQPGDKELLVFNEDSTSEPSLHLEGFQLKGDMLRSAIEGLRLHLPRLSSQEMFDRVCPPDGGNRLCVVMLVKDTPEYNDTVTRAFRELSMSSHSKEQINLGYVDVAKQEEFVRMFGTIPSSLRVCEDGNKARPVIVLKRLSSQQVRFDWYDQFCGAAGDTETLLSHMPSQLKRMAFMSHLLDEEAPGWFGRQLNRVYQFYYDMMDFISVFDPQMLMSVGVLFAGTMLVCCLGLISGGPADEDQNRSHHHSRHHTSGGHRPRQQRSTPPPQQGSPQRRKAPVHYLDSNTYVNLVQAAPKGQLSVILLLNTHDSMHSKPLAQSFWRTMESYNTSHVKVCFLCYRAYPEILGSILSRCEDMSDEERDSRIKMTLSGKGVTVLAVIGSKKQLSIFPATLDADHHRNGAVVGVRMSVGQILGNSLGFDDDNEGDGEQSQNQAQPSTEEDRISECTGQMVGAPTNHKDTAAAAASSASRADGSDPRLVQIKQLGMWMERFFDGSLQRYRVKEWPDWNTVSH